MMNDTKTEALAELNNLSPTKIRRANKRWLLDRASALGIDSIKRGSKEIPISDGLKNDIADAILKALKADRDEPLGSTTLLAVNASESALLDDLPEAWVSPAALAATYFGLVRSLTLSQYDRMILTWEPPLQELASCASRLTIALGSLKQRYSSKQLAPTRKLTFRRDVFAALTALADGEKDKWYHDMLTDNIDQFRKDVYAQMQDLARQKKSDGAERQKDR